MSRGRDLASEVWDENWFGPTKTLDVTMAGLRRRLTGAVRSGSGPVRLPEIPRCEGTDTGWNGRRVRRIEKRLTPRLDVSACR